MTQENKKISSALISVYHKDGLDVIIQKLHQLGVSLYSTGGTWDFIRGLGIPANKVEDLTGYPSIFGGRVKTLHPKVFGGILYRRDEESDLKQAAEYEIPAIDLVIVDLYPFEATVASGAAEEDIIEKIDIGGISLIRAAAKNFKDVIIVPSMKQYEPLLQLLNEKQGLSDLADRRRFATWAFGVSSHYDSAICNYFNTKEQLPLYRSSIDGGLPLRYGENPHQQGFFHGPLQDLFVQLHGKELSYNNLVDIDAGVRLIADLKGTACAILKHTNACGAAIRPVLVDAWKDALAGDPVSAYGGVIVVNREVDVATAEEMDKIFFEVLIAPSYEKNALEILKHKKNRVLLQQNSGTFPATQVKSLLNGIIEQDTDLKTEKAEELKQVTTVAPKESEIADLLFANILAKHTKSNTIVLAKGQQLIGSGIGQTSRVDALKQSLIKAREFGFDPAGAVMASDAFFPFADCVEIAHKAGITAVIQPGGSVRDQLSIDYCNENGLAMVMTGFRHFKH
jgi:phosphoribosylaminoimidazolecarboxamide formyltransferase/IMP cyclohydrolase